MSLRCFAGLPCDDLASNYTASVASLAALDRLQLAGLSREPGGLHLPGIGKRSAQLPGLVLDGKLRTLERNRCAGGRDTFLNEGEQKFYLFVSPATF